MSEAEKKYLYRVYDGFDGMEQARLFRAEVTKETEKAFRVICEDGDRRGFEFLNVILKVDGRFHETKEDAIDTYLHITGRRSCWPT